MSGEYICEAIEAIMEYERINEIADLFKMFGDATRVKILFSLFDRELSVTEIVEKIGASQTAVSPPCQMPPRGQKYNLFPCR